MTKMTILNFSKRALFKNLSLAIIDQIACVGIHLSDIKFLETKSAIRLDQRKHVIVNNDPDQKPLGIIWL